jgi:hypothetical protein
MKRQSVPAYVLIAVAVGAYLLSLSLPAFHYADWPDGYRAQRPFDIGASVLAWGALGALLGQFGWYANIMGLAALVLALLDRRGAARLLALVGFALGLYSLLLVAQPLPLDEGGMNTVTVSRLGSGFYVWELSFLLLAASQFVPRREVLLPDHDEN